VSWQSVAPRVVTVTLAEPPVAGSGLFGTEIVTMTGAEAFSVLGLDAGGLGGLCRDGSTVTG
jgi:hypothetical protein